MAVANKITTGAIKKRTKLEGVKAALGEVAAEHLQAGGIHMPLPAAAPVAGPAKLENFNLVFNRQEQTHTGPITHLSHGQVGLVRQLVHEEVEELQRLLVAKGGVPPAHTRGIEASETRGGWGFCKFSYQKKKHLCIVCFE